MLPPMADRITPASVNFFDPEVNDCPYGAYQVLRDEAPIWRDPVTGMFVITRYDDLKTVLTDTARFSSVSPSAGRGAPGASERGRKIRDLYQTQGWLPAATLAGRDDPDHRQMRALFDHAFRPSRIKQLDSFVEQLAHRLIDSFIDRGSCDWVREFAVPLPLIVIGHQMGAPEQDIWRIKAWTDAWVQRLGLMQSEQEAIWSTEMEIEAQHYFQAIFERLRQQPDDTLLSDIVNTEVPGWGRTLNDNELHAEMMADTFVGGSETSTNALSAGVMLLIENPQVWRRLKDDPERHLPTFVEEVVRLEGPVQGLFRTAVVDIELHGVTIPAGSVLNVRYAAAHRDERQFVDADTLDVERTNAKSHLGFGFGVHYCLGAPLARRELFLGFRALVERIDHLRYGEGDAPGSHQPNFCLRALTSLPIAFTRSTR